MGNMDVASFTIIKEDGSVQDNLPPWNIDLHGQTFTVGYTPDCDIQIAHPKSAALQQNVNCKLKFYLDENDQIWVMNKNSNISVNKKTLNKGRMFSVWQGDVIKFG